MSNSLFNQMQNSTTQTTPQLNNPQIQSIKQMVSMLNNNSNPQQLLNMMIQKNPQLAQIMNLVNNKGITPKQLFMQLANQKGINPNTIINMLK